MPHHCSTICLVGNTINHGERGGRGIWEAGGKGSPSWIRVTYYWETHLWEEPPVGPGVRRKVCVPVVVHKEGGVSPGAGSRHCAPIYQAQCVPPWDAGDQATLSKATTDLLGFLAPSVLELTSCSGPDTSETPIIHPAHCSQLRRVSSQGSSCLKLAMPQPSALVQYFLLVLQAVRVRAHWLPFGMNKAQVSAFESKLTADTFQPC